MLASLALGLIIRTDTDGCMTALKQTQADATLMRLSGLSGHPSQQMDTQPSTCTPPRADDRTEARFIQRAAGHGLGISAVGLGRSRMPNKLLLLLIDLPAVVSVIPISQGFRSTPIHVLAACNGNLLPWQRAGMVSARSSVAPCTRHETPCAHHHAAHGNQFIQQQW